VIPFVGEFRHACDDQGRINIPARFRDLLKLEKNNVLVATKGLENCISIFPFSEWERFAASLTTPRIEAEREGRYFRRQLLHGCETLQPDAQGRIQIGKALREYAGIKKDAVVYGIGPRFEIWSAERFEDYWKAGEIMGGSLEENAARYMWGSRPDASEPAR
jgi:MraZ protein